MTDDEKLFAKALTISVGMQRLLRQISEDEFTPPDYKPAIKILLQQWDSIKPVEEESEAEIVKIDETTLHPALRPRHFEHRYGETGSHRVERILLYLNQEGPRSSLNIMDAINLSRNQVYYALKRGPFRLIEDENLWVALRLSSLWTSESAMLFGLPQIGSNEPKEQAG